MLTAGIHSVNDKGGLRGLNLNSTDKFEHAWYSVRGHAIQVSSESASHFAANALVYIRASVVVVKVYITAYVCPTLSHRGPCVIELWLLCVNTACSDGALDSQYTIVQQCLPEYRRAVRSVCRVLVGSYAMNIWCPSLRCSLLIQV